MDLMDRLSEAEVLDLHLRSTCGICIQQHDSLLLFVLLFTVNPEILV